MTLRCRETRWIISMAEWSICTVSPSKKPKQTEKQNKNQNIPANPQIFSGLYYRLFMAIVNQGALLGSQLQLSMSKPQIFSRGLSLREPSLPGWAKGFTAACAVPGSNKPPQNSQWTQQPCNNKTMTADYARRTCDRLTLNYKLPSCTRTVGKSPIPHLSSS